MRIELGRALVRMPEPAGDLVQRHALLREPSPAGMAQGVSGDVSDPGPLAGRPERPPDALDRLSFIRHHPGRGGAALGPGEQEMQSSRYRDDRPAFIGARPPGLVEIDPAGDEIDLRPPRPKNSTLTRAGVERDQDEKGEMRPRLRFATALP